MTISAHPTVLWAQRTNLIFLTIQVPSVCDAQISIEKQKIKFKGTGGSGQCEGIEYEVELELFDEINVEKSHYMITGLGVLFTLVKHQLDQPFWPRLLASSTKPRFLKTDFSRWKDEDESVSDDDGDLMRNLRTTDFNPAMSMPKMEKIGKNGDMGIPNMEGFDMEALSGMGGMDKNHPDSDDEDEEVDTELAL